MRTAVAPQLDIAAATLWRCGGRDCGAGECEHEENELHRQAAGSGPVAPPRSRHRVSHPDDPAEREAERVADEIMSGGGGTGSLSPSGSSVVQRKGTADMSDFDWDEEVMRSTTGSQPRARLDLDDQIRSLRSGGDRLDVTTRAFMEQRFGHDFSQVRVHRDESAARTARVVSAHAFTVGHDIAFAPGQYQPSTRQGRRLIAHELAHVVQQSGARPAASGGAEAVQRDLATAPPDTAVEDQPDLTEDQIRSAIAFNRARYDESNTRLIQDLAGGEVTGTWTRENVVAIAALQEEYGLTADGKVGSETFRFLNNEQVLEGMDTANESCLTAFNVNVGPVVFISLSPASIEGHFRTAAEFSSRCRCSSFQYRQFIRGHARHIRGGVTTDISTAFANIPGGRLPANFVEDGDTSDTPVNYGHRDQPADTTPEDHYINDRNADDQRNGCRYRNEDFPGLTGITNIRAGDVFDLNISFRGEIQRNGRAVRTKRWSAINGRFTIP